MTAPQMSGTLNLKILTPLFLARTTIAVLWFRSHSVPKEGFFSFLHAKIMSYKTANGAPVSLILSINFTMLSAKIGELKEFII